MEILIPVLIALAIVVFILYVVPRITVIPDQIRMVVIAVTILIVVIWLLRSILPRVT